MGLVEGDSPVINVLVYDVAAEFGGALSILTDFYEQVRNIHNDDIIWHFVLSIPKLDNQRNIRILKYPWVKRGVLFRLWFDFVQTRIILKKCKIDVVISLQNTTIPFCKKPQIVSLHNTLPFFCCNLSVISGMKSVIRQYFINKNIIRSLKTAHSVMVPAKWIKELCCQRYKVNGNKIHVLPMEIDWSNIQTCTDLNQAKTSFFYPATAQPYKRHMIILKACKDLKTRNINCNIVFTISGEENIYAVKLKEYSKKYNLNVVFIGMIPRQEVLGYYAKSVLLFPSVIETDALPLEEAKASNGFIFASKTPFSQEILANYLNCAFFQDEDFKKLSLLMEDMISGRFILRANKCRTGRTDVINRAELCLSIIKNLRIS